MLRNVLRSPLPGLLGVALVSSGVLAIDCGSVSITSAADAEILRQSCPTVTGSITIGPFTQPATQHINLDGVAVIQGDLQSYENDINYETVASSPFTVSSTTLREVHGAVDFARGATQLWNLSLPNLTAVTGSFSVSSAPISYLDITSLEFASNIAIQAQNLTTLRHTKLTNITSLNIQSVQVNSIDSFLNNAIDVENVYVAGPLPNIDKITIGFPSVISLTISASVNVTLGAASTTKMDLIHLNLGGGLTGVNRNPVLQSLTGYSLRLSDTALTRLDLPFDNLGFLWLGYDTEDSTLEQIRLPPVAVNWTSSNGFWLITESSPSLNLSSQYGTDDAGNRIQTWYWPTNMTSIEIDNTIVGNDFFETFVSQQMKPLTSTPPPAILEYFTVTPTANSNFNCTPFNTLRGMGRLPSSATYYTCNNAMASESTDSGSNAIRVPYFINVSSLLGLILLVVLCR
ncbi:hypothetical protein N7451_005694 [Penicillium sp. IBT 35674x]|nr:hypothetical protein N7451_005694 [Penicillium sp. IBT 35674x]